MNENNPIVNQREDAAVEYWKAEATRLREHCREVIDMIIPNESEYKCDYRREWALRVLTEGNANGKN